MATSSGTFPSRTTRLRTPMFRSAACALVTFLAIAVAQPVMTQRYPDKPVRMVVPLAAGGPLDVTARLFAAKLAVNLGQPFLVENQPGAAGNQGMEAVARSAPDGHTLLWAIDSMLTVNPMIYPGLGDPLEKLRPAALLVENTSVLVVPASLGVRTSAELIKLSQSREIFYASAGSGSPGHRYMEYYKLLAGVRMTHVPYKGNAPAVQSLLAGDTLAFITPIAGVLPHLRSGRLSSLAVTSSKRSQVLPDTPTMTELGYSGFNAVVWYTVLAPAATPDAVVDLLYRELSGAIRSPDIRKALTDQGAEPFVNTPAAVVSRVQAERKLWQEVVRKTGMKLD